MASTSQISNTLGAQVVYDGEVPRTITATAIETISGGYLVNISGATNNVGSQVSSYTGGGDLLAVGAQDITSCNGIALNNAGSNQLVTIARKGSFLMRCGGAVSGGTLVAHNASGAVLNWKGSVSGTTAAQETFIGRAITSSTSGTGYYSLVGLDC